MSDTKPLSILDERPPSRDLSFNQKALVAALIVFVAAPIAITGFIITVMILLGGPR